VNEKSTVSADCASADGSIPANIAEPVKPCGVPTTFKVIATTVPISANKFVCAVSLVSMNALILAVQLLIVGMFIAQLPLAPNGVTSLVAFLMLSVHFEASVKDVLASKQFAPIPAKAANFLLPS
jgi:hypothetical protein